MAIYMEYEGVKGNVTTAGYQGMIELDFFVLRTSRRVGMTVGELANREFKQPEFGYIETGKRLDGSIVGVLKETVTGATGKKVQLHFVRTGQRQLQAYMTLVFYHCLPTLYRIIALSREGGIPAERLYLGYSAFEISYINRGEDNKTQNTQRYGYDIAAARAM